MFFNPVPLFLISGTIGGLLAGFFLATRRLQWPLNHLVLAGLVGGALGNLAAITAGIPPASQGSPATDFFAVMLAAISLGVAAAMLAVPVALRISRTLQPLLTWQPQTSWSRRLLLGVALLLCAAASMALYLVDHLEWGIEWQPWSLLAATFTQGIAGAGIVVLTVFVVYGRQALWQRIVSGLVIGASLLTIHLTGEWISVALQPDFLWRGSAPPLPRFRPLLLMPGEILIALAILWISRLVMSVRMRGMRASGQFRIAHLLVLVSFTCIALAGIQFYVASADTFDWEGVWIGGLAIALLTLFAVVPLAWAALAMRQSIAASFCLLYAVSLTLVVHIILWMTSSFVPKDDWLYCPYLVCAFLAYHALCLLRRLDIVSSPSAGEATRESVAGSLWGFAIVSAPTVMVAAAVAIAVVQWRLPHWRQQYLLKAGDASVGDGGVATPSNAGAQN